MDVSRQQLERDKNALRGLWDAKPGPKDMQTILLHAGEEIQPAVRAMVESGELANYITGEREYFRRTQKMKPYRLT
jgi:hypothetical protein